MKPLLFKFAFILLGFMVGIGAKETATGELAFEVKCPRFTLRGSPADGYMTLERVQTLAECMGETASRICTIRVVRIRENK